MLLSTSECREASWHIPYPCARSSSRGGRFHGLGWPPCCGCCATSCCGWHFGGTEGGRAGRSPRQPAPCRKEPEQKGLSAANKLNMMASVAFRPAPLPEAAPACMAHIIYDAGLDGDMVGAQDVLDELWARSSAFNHGALELLGQGGGWALRRLSASLLTVPAGVTICLDRWCPNPWVPLHPASTGSLQLASNSIILFWISYS